MTPADYVEAIALGLAALLVGTALYFAAAVLLGRFLGLSSKPTPPLVRDAERLAKK